MESSLDAILRIKKDAPSLRITNGDAAFWKMADAASRDDIVA
jgi:hypothetical protein